MFSGPLAHEHTGLDLGAPCGHGKIADRGVFGLRRGAQNRPMVLPSASISTFSAVGASPSPGIWVSSPHNGTSQPAPV